MPVLIIFPFLKIRQVKTNKGDNKTEPLQNLVLATASCKLKTSQTNI